MPLFCLLQAIAASNQARTLTMLSLRLEKAHERRCGDSASVSRRGTRILIQ